MARITSKQKREARIEAIAIELAEENAVLAARKARGENITPMDLRKALQLHSERRILMFANFGK